MDVDVVKDRKPLKIDKTVDTELTGKWKAKSMLASIRMKRKKKNRDSVLTTGYRRRRRSREGQKHKWDKTIHIKLNEK